MKLRFLLVVVLALGLFTPASGQEVSPELQEAAKLHQAGKLDQALKIYNKLLADETKLEPDQRAGALLMRGRARYQKRDLKGAAADYDAAIALVPDNAIAYLSRAALRAELRDFQGALPDLDRVLAVRSDFLPAIVARARVLGELRRFADAAETWGRVVALHPNDAVALHQRGASHSAAGDRVQALRDFDAALGLAADRPEVLLDRAALRASAGDYAEALADIERAKALVPAEAAPFRLRGRVRFEQGDYAAAVSDLVAADAAAALKARRDPYLALWLHMARLRAGAAEPGDLRKRLGDADLRAWPGPILRHFLGEASPESVLVAAEAAPAGAVRNEQLCEAYFYLAEAELAAGRVEAGEALLRKAAATDATWLVEWNSAQAELKRLAK
ncbi:tetratricopeptide repeat protein [Desertibaculum subflavum]|uniref:tetratricopeptide repeat protein n=1 Tax=Desertibaculum subflavum TaxID=2268458 RepID=UPI000E66C6E0